MLSIPEDLKAMDDIRQLKGRYFRFVDTKDWDGLATVFCRDAVFDTRGAATGDPDDLDPAMVYEGRDAIVGMIRDTTGDLVTVHHGHCHEVTVDAPDRAHGVIAMDDIIGVRDTGRVILEGWGHYHEEYRREDGQWRIWRSRLTRLKVVANFQPGDR
jgi:hypothetical protein